MINHTLTKLIDLQQVDLAIDAANAAIAGINVKTALFQDGLKAIKDNIDGLKKEMQQCAVLKKEKELATSDIDAQIRKHNMELNTIRSNDAYKALLKEIETGKKDKTAIEDEILAIMETEEQKSAEIKKLQDESAAGEKEFLQNKAGFEADIKSNETKINELTEQRKAKVEELPLNINKQYENIRKNKKGPIVVEIKDFICGGCHRNLPLQIVDQVLQGNDIILCDHCQRILYKKP